jgi:hypothetical protein
MFEFVEQKKQRNEYENSYNITSVWIVMPRSSTCFWKLYCLRFQVNDKLSKQHE